MAAPTSTSHKAQMPTSTRESHDRTVGGAGSGRGTPRSRGAALARRGGDPHGFITAEALYPGVYTTHTNTVSHPGASEPPNSVVLQPSAAIFDITMLVIGP